MVPEKQREKREKPVRDLAERRKFRNHKNLLFSKARNPKPTSNPQPCFFNAVLRTKPVSDGRSMLQLTVRGKGLSCGASYVHA